MIGLVSSWREGRLLLQCLETLARACDRVYVLEAPVAGTDPTVGEASRLPRRAPSVVVRQETVPYLSDASKRTALVRWAQEKVGEPAWAIVLDGDEILWAPELLPDVLWRSEQEDQGVGGVTLRLVEAGDDPVVYQSSARVLPLHLIEQYVLSSHVIEFTGLGVISLPLLPSERPPAWHEPHIVHRSYLRPPRRNEREQRLSSHELRELARLGVAI